MPAHMQRYREIAQVLARNGLYVTAQRAGLGRWLPPLANGAVDPRGEADIVPPMIVQTLRELGTTFVKFGQALSMRHDILPDSWCTALGELTDSEPPIDVSEVERAIRDDLGAGVEELYATFDPQPLATASIGQAHAATLPDGRAVVVKVRKPGVVEEVNEDLEILANLSGQLARSMTFFADIDLPGMVAEFSRSLRTEMDYSAEARACQDFGAFFAGDARIHVPWIDWDRSSTRVLTLERLSGIRIDDVAALDAAGVDRQALALRCADMLLRMVFEMGRFHADPHSGNLFVEPDGTIGVIDFGMIGRMTPLMARQFVAIIVGMTRNDSSAVADALTTLAPPRGRLDRAALRADVRGLLARLEDKRLSDVSVVDVAGRLFTIVRDHRLALPPDVVLLLRMLAIVDGLGRRIDPDFRLADAFGPFTERMLPEHLADRLATAARDVTSLGAELPGYLRRIADRLDGEGVDVHIRADGAVDRLVAGMIVAALISGGSRVLVANQQRLGPWSGPILTAGAGLLGVIGGRLLRPRKRRV